MEDCSYPIQNFHTYQEFANKPGQMSNPDKFRNCAQHNSKIIEFHFRKSLKLTKTISKEENIAKL